MLTVYSVVASGTFERGFKKLDRSVQMRVDKKIRWAISHPENLQQFLRHMPNDLSALQKLRVGDYRVLLWVDHVRHALTLYPVEHRSAVYKDL